jgi:hypothetical protein
MPDSAFSIRLPTLRQLLITGYEKNMKPDHGFLRLLIRPGFDLNEQHSALR